VSDILSRARRLLARPELPGNAGSAAVPSASAISAGGETVGAASTPGLDDGCCAEWDWEKGRNGQPCRGPCRYGCPVTKDQAGFFWKWRSGK
jgi:hypothetical protein